MIKKHKDKDYEKGWTTCSNHIHYNKELPLQAKYLFILLLGLPKTYSVSYKALARLTGEGEKKIKNNLEKLVAQGYLNLEQTQCRDEQGRWAVGFNCEIYELPEQNPLFNVGEDEVTVLTKGRHGQKAVTAKGQQYNKNYLNKENCNLKNKINSPCETESSKSEDEKPLPGNQTPKGEEKARKLADLFNETGGMGEALAESMPNVSTNPPVRTAQSEIAFDGKRVVKSIMKEYSHLDFEVLEKAIQLAFEKEIDTTKGLIGYVLTLLSDWNAHDYTTIEKVEAHLERINNKQKVKRYNGKKVIREEMTPDWLPKVDLSKIVPFNPNQNQSQIFSKEEEQKRIERMQEIHKEMLAIEKAESQLPF